jgi:hypothetical protein
LTMIRILKKMSLTHRELKPTAKPGFTHQESDIYHW